MKRFLAAGALLMLVGLASEARSQGVVVGSGSWSGRSVPAAGTTNETTYVPPYSYYASFPHQARQYVGFTGSSAVSSPGGCSNCGGGGSGGDQNFPFYGQPYGHVYDKWTWSYMAERTGSRFNPW